MLHLHAGRDCRKTWQMKMSVLCLSFAALIMLPSFAMAQWVATGRWGDVRYPRYIQPGTWVYLDESSDLGARASLNVEGMHHDTRLALICEAGNPEQALTFSGYRGFDLPAALDLTPDTEIDAVLTLDDTAHAVILRYHAVLDAWRIVWRDDLNPGRALPASRRASLALESGALLGQYRFRGGRSAGRSYRRTCGI